MIKDGQEDTDNNQNEPVITGNGVGSQLSDLSIFLGKDEVEAMKKDLKIPDSDENQGADGEGGEDGEGNDGAAEGAGDENLTDEQKAEAEEAKKEAEKVAKEKEAAAKKPEGKNLFGLKKTGDKKNDVVIENPEQILEVVKSKFGQEYKDIKELPKFFETAQGWREKAQRTDESEKKLNGFIDLLSSAPEPLIEALRNYEAGKDWEEPLKNRPKFDFSTSVDKQDIKALVNHYYPGKFTEEDMKDENPSELLKMAMDVSKDKFNAEKTTRDAERALVSQKADLQLKAQTAAVQSSVNHLKQTFPDMDTDVLKDIQSTLEGGINNVLAFFYNNDGTAKPEAAKMLMMAKHGEDQIQEMMVIASHVTETKINEDLVSRGADTKKPVKNTGPRDQISDEAKKKLDEFERMNKAGKPTF